VAEVPPPLGRLPGHRLLLGLFLPMQQGAWSPSKAPRSTSWTFDYIARCATMAETLGFDLVFGLTLRHPLHFAARASTP
jgi:dimethylsulfone monooxygenase